MAQAIFLWGLLIALVGLIWLFILDMLNDILGDEHPTSDGVEPQAHHHDNRRSRHDSKT
jgi:putative exporter of polyketide antibiotics